MICVRYSGQTLRGMLAVLRLPEELEVFEVEENAGCGKRSLALIQNGVATKVIGARVKVGHAERSLGLFDGARNQSWEDRKIEAYATEIFPGSVSSYAAKCNASGGFKYNL